MTINFLELGVGVLAVLTLINTFVLWGTARNVSRLIDHEIALMDQEAKLWHAKNLTYRDTFLVNQGQPSDGVNISHLR